MQQALEFIFDFSSAYSYLAARSVEDLGREIGRTVTWRPILLGAVFATRGSAPPPAGSAKLAYLHADLVRSAARMGLPYVTPDPHPFNSMLAARCFYAIDAHDPACAKRFALESFVLSYVQGQDLSQEPVVARAAQGAGVDGADLIARSAQAEVKARLRAETEAAIERGVFGAPTLFLDGEMFWGADRFDHVRDRAAGKARPAA